MKTSNIILTAVFGSFSLVIFTGAMQLRFTGTTENNWKEKEVLNQPLAAFKYLVIDASTNVTITAAPSAALIVTTGSTDDAPVVEYRQAGDTLFINRVQHGENGESLTATLQVPTSSIRLIRATGSSFQLMDYPANGLTLELDDSRAGLHGESVSEFGNVQCVLINDSHIYTDHVKLDTIDIKLDGSRADLNGHTNKVKGLLKNNSHLQTGDADDVEYKKDGSSRVY